VALRPEIFFLRAPEGDRFAVHHAPARSPAREAWLYVHPFAEEMNKSRRMAARQARAFAAQGVAVLQLDLLGCGDSSGDFADATWDAWIDDVRWGVSWLRERHPDAMLGLWGLRAGCLLAAAAASTIDDDLNFLFWQPVVSGKQHLTQFLRLASASAWAGSTNTMDAKAARQALDANLAVEIAGYALSPALARGLEAATLEPPPRARHACWLEVGNDEEPGLSPATQRAIDTWQARHAATCASRVGGPAFWQTQEIEDAPDLIDATMKLRLGPTPSSSSHDRKAEVSM
jgi:uncharacterized protein